MNHPSKLQEKQVQPQQKKCHRTTVSITIYFPPHAPLWREDTDGRGDAFRPKLSR